METEAPLGYGDYVFDIECAVRELPADVALTFGTFRNDDSALLVRFTRHGWDSAKSGEFLVPGVDGGTARFRFAVPVDAMQTRHVIAWRPHQVTFSSFRRWGGILGDQIAQWAYRGDQVPAALTERVRVALTTDRGARAEACESRLERFSFRRYSPITIRRGGTV